MCHFDFDEIPMISEQAPRAGGMARSLCNVHGSQSSRVCVQLLCLIHLICQRRQVDCRMLICFARICSIRGQSWHVLYWGDTEQPFWIWMRLLTYVQVHGHMDGQPYQSIDADLNNDLVLPVQLVLFSPSSMI